MTVATEAVTSQRLNLLGISWPREDDLEFRHGSYWHFDPITKTFWPGAEKYCFDVDYRHNPIRGDVKFVWELNRLQFLQPAALLAAKENNPVLSRQVVSTVLRWMEANPPFSGVNWSSGIELALRLVSLAVIISAIKECLTDAALRSRLRTFVAAHAYWLARFPSLFSSANNHRVAEGLGLIVAARLAPDLPEAGHYFSEGVSIIRNASVSQFYSDGVGAEQSPTYSAFTLEMIALAEVVIGPADHHNDRLHRQRLLKAASYLHMILDHNGACPRIGDDDEGRVLAISPIHEHRYVASVTAALAGLLNEPDLCPASRDVHWRDLLFEAPASGKIPKDGIRSFKEGGYTVVREKIAGRNVLLVFDHGPLGFLSIAAHGHADALALWLHLDGIPIFVDAGTFLYHSGGLWRDHFRATGAHNTLELEGQSQSLTAGSFNWKHKANAWLEKMCDGADWSVTARHDGYISRFGVEHERVIRRTNEGIMVTDRLIDRLDRCTERPSSAKVSFLVNPLLKLVKHGSHVILTSEDAPLVRLSCDPGSRLEINTADCSEGQSFYSPCFGVKIPAPAISIIPTDLSNPITMLIEVIPAPTAETRGTNSLLVEADNSGR